MGFGGSSGGGGGALSGASDVALNSVAENQSLQYNASTAKWTNGAVAARLVENINVVPSSGSALTIPDVSEATITLTSLNANCTITFPTPALGKSFSLRIVYEATSRTVTWPSSVRWPNDTPPVLTNVQGKQDLFSFVCLSSSGLWMGFVAGQNYSAS